MILFLAVQANCSRAPKKQIYFYYSSSPAFKVKFTKTKEYAEVTYTTNQNSLDNTGTQPKPTQVDTVHENRFLQFTVFPFCC